MENQYKVIHYKDVYAGTLHIQNGSVNASNRMRVNTRKTKGKVAVVTFPSSYRRPYDYLDMSTSDCCIGSGGKSLYIVEGCKRPRDLYRVSGYKLVNNPDNATCVVIPNLPKKPLYLKYNVIALDRDTNNLYVYSVRSSRSSTYDPVYAKSDFELIQKYFKEWNMEYFHTEIQNDDTALLFLPKCDVYEKILTDKTYRSKYCFALEEDVELRNPVTISVETLDIWSRMLDYDVLAQEIVTSNWEKYPITLLVFLRIVKPSIRSASGTAIQNVLRTIEYPEVNYFYTIKDRVVDPEDWNMLQRYIMHRLGVDEQGGYIDQDIRANNSMLLKFVKTAYCVAPSYISAPITVENIKHLTEVG